MVTEVFAGIGAFKAMFDMAKALKDINGKAIRNAAIIELQEQILGAQLSQAALLERVNHLEEEMTRLETWDTEKQRYELKSLAPGSFAYTLKNDASGTEPPHEICAACYERVRKSIIQRVPGNIARSHLSRAPTYRCPECRTEVVG